MTAEERAKQLAKWIVDGALRQDEIEKSIVGLLKEQDKLTRHACAREILSTAVHTHGEHELLIELAAKCRALTP